MGAFSRDSKSNAFTWWAIGFVWEVFLSIAVPTTLFAWGGRWLDQRLHVSPLFVILGLVLALAVTYFLMRRKVVDLNAAFNKQCQKPCPPCKPEPKDHS